jgi:hypothetical protein
VGAMGMAEELTKICKHCYKELTLNKFNTSKKTKDGREGKCKDCRKSSRPVHLLICETCDTEYQSIYRNSSFCCLECSNKAKAHSFEEIKEEFISNGCVLLEENYENSKQLLNYICQCGTVSKIRYNDFRKGVRCQTCKKQKCSKSNDKTRLSLSDIKSYFKERDYELISTCYRSNRSKLSYICPNGHEGTTTYSDFKRGRRCKKCYRERRAEIERFSYDYVKAFFEKNSCELLEKKYINSGTKMRYRCSCGRESEIRFRNFKNGQRCIECSRERLKGSGHPRWNPFLSDEERENDRNIPGYDDWRLEVYTRDKFTCICCGDNKGGNLVAHHKDGYHWCVEGRTGVNNGVTLCEECHADFHSIYGFKFNTREQFNEWLRNKK